MEFILDSSAVFSRPELLALGDNKTRFFLTQISSNELRHGRFDSEFKVLLDQAIAGGRLQILPLPTDNLADIPAAYRGEMSAEDMLVLLSVVAFKNERPATQVFFVADDIEILRFASKLNIETATSKSIDKLLLTTDSRPDPDVATAAVAISRRLQMYLGGSLIVALAVSGLLLLTWRFGLSGTTKPTKLELCFRRSNCEYIALFVSFACSIGVRWSGNFIRFVQRRADSGKFNNGSNSIHPIGCLPLCYGTRVR